MPTVAGFIVASLQTRGFAPALKSLSGAIEGVVDAKNTLPKDYGPVFRKATASAITLGKGNAVLRCVPLAVAVGGAVRTLSPVGTASVGGPSSDFTLNRIN